MSRKKETPTQEGTFSNFRQTPEHVTNEKCSQTDEKDLEKSEARWKELMRQGLVKMKEPKNRANYEFCSMPKQPTEENHSQTDKKDLEESQAIWEELERKGLVKPKELKYKGKDESCQTTEVKQPTEENYSQTDKKDLEESWEIWEKFEKQGLVKPKEFNYKGKDESCQITEVKQPNEANFSQTDKIDLEESWEIWEKFEKQGLVKPKELNYKGKDESCQITEVKQPNEANKSQTDKEDLEESWEIWEKLEKQGLVKSKELNYKGKDESCQITEVKQPNEANKSQTDKEDLEESWEIWEKLEKQGLVKPKELNYKGKDESCQITEVKQPNEENKSQTDIEDLEESWEIWEKFEKQGLVKPKELNYKGKNESCQTCQSSVKPKIRRKAVSSQTPKQPTEENPNETGRKDLEESQALWKAVGQGLEILTGEKHKDKDKLKSVISTLKKLQISLQESQKPQPSSQTDQESLTQQPPPTGQSDLCLKELQKPSCPTDSFLFSSSPPPPPGQLESKFTEEDEESKQALCAQLLKTNSLPEVEDYQVNFYHWYTDFFDKISELGLVNKTKAEFMEINNYYERVKYVLQFEEVRNLEIVIYDSKSESCAENLEKACNKYSFPPTPKLLQAGLELINKSIQYTPGTDKKSLAIRLMKRGYIKVVMKKFDEARQDAYTSLEYNSEPSLMWYSYETLGYCYANRTDYSIAEHFFKEALAGLRQSDADNVLKAASAGRISKVLKQVKGRENMGGLDESCTEDLKPPLISHGINRILKNATEAVEVKIKPETGRGLYAKKNLKPGDVIIVEQPYVSSLNLENFETNCYYCYKRFKSPIPCDTCSRVWFCKEECLNKAKASFHSSECYVLDYLHEKCIGTVGPLVFRTLLRATWENIKSLRTSEKIDTRLPDTHPLHTEFNTKEKFFTDNYLNVYKLSPNSQKSSFDELFERTLMAVYIKQCLKAREVNFFKEDVSLDDEIFVASLILRHIQSSLCNAHSITELLVKQGQIHSAYVSEIGGGVFPTISLMNHCCYPNIFRYCVGEYSVVRVANMIEKGMELFDSYVPPFDVLDRDSRLEVLESQYKFNCNCVACREKWPLFNDNKVYMRLSCPEKKCGQIVEFNGEKNIRCPSCGFKRKHKTLMAEVRDNIRKYDQGINALKSGHKEEAIIAFKDFQMFADKKIIPPSKFLTDCNDIFQKCFHFQGNLFNHF